MSVPEAGNTLSIPAYTPKAEDATVELEWSQTFKTREATYYIVCAKNVSQEQCGCHAIFPGPIL